MSARHFTRRRPLALLLALTLAAPLAQAGDGPQALTLARTLALMRENNPELQLASAGVEASRADLVIAGERPNPVFSIGTTRIGTHGENGGGSPLWRRDLDTVASWAQPIERGNKRGLRQEVANANVGAAGADRQTLWRDLGVAADNAWHDLAVAQESLRLNQEASTLYQRTLEASELRFRSGDIAAADLARIRVEAARNRSDTRLAEGNLAQAREVMARLLGRADQAGDINASLDWPGVAELPAADSLDAFIEQQPDVTAARWRLQASRKAVELARAQRANDVTIGLQYERDPYSSKPNSMGVGISFPIQIGNNYEGEIRRALADQAGAELLLSTARLQARRRLEAELAALTTAADVLRTYQGDLLDNARTAAASAEYAYQRGASSLLNLLDARRTLRTVQIDALNAQASFSRHRFLWDLLTHPQEI